MIWISYPHFNQRLALCLNWFSIFEFFQIKRFLVKHSMYVKYTLSMIVLYSFEQSVWKSVIWYLMTTWWFIWGRGDDIWYLLPSDIWWYLIWYSSIPADDLSVTRTSKLDEKWIVKQPADRCKETESETDQQTNLPTHWGNAFTFKHISIASMQQCWQKQKTEDISTSQWCVSDVINLVEFDKCTNKQAWSHEKVWYLKMSKKFHIWVFAS